MFYIFYVCFGQRFGEAREVLRTVGVAHLIQLTLKVALLLRSEEEFGFLEDTVVVVNEICGLIRTIALYTRAIVSVVFI
jgi:hypothetical protein